MNTGLSVLIGLPFVVLGLVFAFAGRDIYHTFVSLFGFTVGFSTAVIGFSPLLIEAWVSGSWLALLSRLIAVLVVGGLLGVIGIHWAWFVYRFLIEFPGAVAGAFLAVLFVVPIEGIDWLIVFGAFVLGGHFAWRLHEVFLVINTSWLGSVLVGIGIAWTSLSSLPIVRAPGRLLTNPLEVIAATVAMIQLVAVVVAVVFACGLLVQWSDVPVLGFLSSLLGIVPVPSPGGLAPSGRSATEESDSRTVRKARNTQESVAPNSEPDDDSGFYEK